MKRINAIALGVLCLCPVMAHAEIIGRVFQYKALAEDTPYTIARRFDLGVEELMAANPAIDSVAIAGRPLTIPAAYIVPTVRLGEILINLAERRLYYRLSNKALLTFPIAIGKEGWETPLGETTIVRKRENPVWVPPESLREENPDLPDSVPAGPDNPLGAYALNLGWEGFVIHGTNAPNSIGRRASHGCIRMYPEDIAQLFSLVNTRIRVRVVHQSYKVGFHGSELYLQILPESYTQPVPALINDIYDEIRKVAPDASIDWKEVDKAISVRDGIPAYIGALVTKERSDPSSLGAL